MLVPLIFANLLRKPVRTTLTIASIAVAFLLFGVLGSLRAALSSDELAGSDRMITVHKVSLAQSLPISYVQRIRAVEGVKAATALTWLAAIYQDERNQVSGLAVTPEQFFETYPEIYVSEDQRRAWLNDRRGIMVGRALAERFGWKVGDSIPLRSTYWKQTDGSSTWNVIIHAIYDVKEQRGTDTVTLYMHWDYFNENRLALEKDLIGLLMLRVDHADEAVRIGARIDQRFGNSSAETRTATEQAFAKAFANQLGNIGTIVSTVAFAVFFTMLLVTANTVGQSVRERIDELAVMKAIGFSHARVMALVLMESVFITALGGAIGLALATFLVGLIGPAVQQYLPFSGLPASAYAPGIALIVLLGLLAGALPCIQAFQLKIVEALRGA